MSVNERLLNSICRYVSQLAGVNLWALESNSDVIFRLSSTRIEPNKKVQLKEGKTAVSALQELLQKRGASIPTYKEKGGSGPPFTIYCHVDELISEATGNSKKEAKHKAAENMLIKLQDDVNRAPGIGWKP